MTLHADARRVLASWTAPDTGQEELRARYLDHLDRHDNGVWRACRPGHVTASAAIVDPLGENVVLTLHRKIGLWLQTGGHCEPADTSLAGVALREAEEESGISGLRLLPEPLRLDRHWVGCGGGTWHLDVQYAAIAPKDAPLTHDDAESTDLAWFPVTALPDPSDDACRTLVHTASRAAARSAPLPVDPDETTR